MGYGSRQLRPELVIPENLPKVSTTPRWPSTTMYSPLASHTASTSATSRPKPPPSCLKLGGSEGVPPPPPRLRVKMRFSLWLKLRHISSRSGGPSLPPPPPRFPHLGSFSDLRASFASPGIRSIAGNARIVLFCHGVFGGRRLGERLAQELQAGPGLGAETNAANLTILVSVEPRLKAALAQVDLVPHQ